MSFAVGGSLCHPKLGSRPSSCAASSSSYCCEFRASRAVAELDNVRKRAARDVDAARRSGVEKLAGELKSSNSGQATVGVEGGLSLRREGEGPPRAWCQGDGRSLCNARHHVAT